MFRKKTNMSLEDRGKPLTKESNYVQAVPPWYTKARAIQDTFHDR